MTSLVLVFGESTNDTGALKHLVPSLIPEGVQIEVRSLRQPFTLSREANNLVRKKVASAIRVTELGEAKSGRKVVVVAHHDCDNVEPAHEAQRTRLRDDLLAAGVENPVVAAPAWDIEAWWMLFPDAVARVRLCWRRLNYGQSSTGRISNAKDRLTRDLRPQNNLKCKDYRESDSIRIAEEIAAAGIEPSALARNASLRMFKDDLTAALMSN